MPNQIHFPRTLSELQVSWRPSAISSQYQHPQPERQVKAKSQTKTNEAHFPLMFCLVY